jgi:type II secretory pathway pseudopilin PulG
MLVVMVIIASLAALVVPALGFVEDQADGSTSALTTAQVASNLKTYKAATGVYPLGMDSLIDDTDAIYGGLWAHTNPNFGPREYLEVLDGSAYSGSIAHSFGSNSNGDRYVYDHDSALDPDEANNSATIRRVLSSSDYDLAGVIAYAPPSGPPGPAQFVLGWYEAAGFPSGTLPAGARLIAMGLGPNTGVRGDTASSIPSQVGQSTETYGRYIALFLVHDDGRPATLRAVVDSYGSSIESNIAEYREASPQHE